ncbi:uncharacterized protein LAESUDRAFT_730369 [Laetiporus sulphureus 93-53]|uniref:Uncharacterized protein n=1 Tax=Laetiporus sulphureus 93-53 TaxID=1314785 RepID=A0A165C8N7_9APHY|nr:uncharacterized protein LAESUDRAFT_730369 [Laetiporus sulphureus 93-53]KZT02394.1 hypothetical protein LAESUDRAFT_730369 [Laetiporus sulphureus 93-53]
MSHVEMRPRTAIQAEHDGCALPDQHARQSREFKLSAGAAEERTGPGFQQNTIRTRPPSRTSRAFVDVVHTDAICVHFRLS